MKMDKKTGKDLVKVKAYTKYIYGMIIVIVLLDQLIKIILSCVRKCNYYSEYTSI